MSNKLVDKTRRHFNNMRSYVMGDEAGLLMASWPKGRLEVPFPYFSEVMTGCLSLRIPFGIRWTGRRHRSHTVCVLNTMLQTTSAVYMLQVLPGTQNPISSVPCLKKLRRIAVDLVQAASVSQISFVLATVRHDDNLQASTSAALILPTG